MNKRVFCAWCQQWKHGHKIKIIHHNYEDDLGSEEWKTYKMKIHKHHKGNQMCKGSDKIVSIDPNKTKS